MAEDEQDIMAPGDLGRKLVLALRSVSEPQALMQAIADRAVANVRQELTTKIEGMDRATNLWHDDLVRVPTDLQEAVGALRELMEKTINFEVAVVADELHQHVAATLEKFLAVAAQFTERDTRTDQRAGDTKLAVDAAFAAAKEATAKIEAGFTKQIDSMIGMVDTQAKFFAGQISDLKERLTIMESRTAVSDPSTAIALAGLRSDMASLGSSRDVGVGMRHQAESGHAMNIALGGMAISLMVAIVAVVTLIVTLSHVAR
jgi:hypothetical protein